MKLKNFVLSKKVLALLLIVFSTTSFSLVNAKNKPQVDSSPQVLNQPISFQGPDGLNMTGRLYKPEGDGPFPAIVFMHGCSGLLTGAKSTNYLASQYVWWGEKMAKDEKVVALFVDSFTARGIEDVCGNGNILNEATERPKDAYAGLSYLRTLNYVEDNKVSLMGWSNGGSAVLSSMAKNNNPVAMPAEGGFVSAIAEYPGCGLRNHYGTDYSTVNTKGTYLPYAPVIILGGENDTTTPPNPKCVNLVNQAKVLGASEATGNPINLTIYAGAKHSFDGAKDGSGTAADLAARDAGRTVALTHFKTVLILDSVSNKKPNK